MQKTAQLLDSLVQATEHLAPSAKGQSAKAAAQAAGNKEQPSSKSKRIKIVRGKGCPLRQILEAGRADDDETSSSSEDECPLRPLLQPQWSSRSHELLGRTIRRRFLGHKVYDSDSLTADQYRTTLDSETPTQVAEKIGCSVTELLALNNDREQTTDAFCARCACPFAHAVI